MKLGYNSYINARWMQTGLMYGDIRLNKKATLQQTQCTYFDSIIFDMSQFGNLFGTECDTYILTDTEAFPYHFELDKAPIFTQFLLQDRSYLET